MQKYRRILLWAVLTALLLSVPVFATEQEASTGSLDNFIQTAPASFCDVPKGAWYYENVRFMSALGLMSGTGGKKFEPNKSMEVGEVVSLAARVYAIYFEGTLDTLNALPSKGGWFVRYFDYLEGKGLLEAEWRAQVTNAAPRSLFAVLLSRILPSDDLLAINLIESIPDGEEYEQELLPLYRAGVLIGNDAFGNFEPSTPIERSAAAAICSRLVSPKLRVKFLFVPDGVGVDENFVDSKTYDGRFADVKKTHWFYENVVFCYNKDLMTGRFKREFAPRGQITMAEVATVAARFHCRWLTGSTAMLDRFPSDGEWYERYYDYLEKAGLLTPAYRKNPNAPATRENAVGLFGVMVYGKLKKINSLTAVPDGGEHYEKEILSLYNAGILSGKDRYFTFGAKDHLERCEMAALLCRLADSSRRLKLTVPKAVEYFSYGKSGAGRTLNGWRIGTGGKALVLTFTLHGWEDNWSRDGWMLTNTANALIETLKNQVARDPASMKNWTVYLLPLCNPDGLLDGTSANGIGRRTMYSYDASGKLIKKGIDLNRAFPYGYSPQKSERYYNGSAPLASPEARALDSFLKQVAARHTTRYLVDVHGWYNQIVAPTSESLLQNAFLSQFPSIEKTPMGGGGFFCSYAHYNLGYHAALFEFPNVSSAKDFQNRRYEQKFIASIQYILKR